MADRVTWTSGDGSTVIDFTDDVAGYNLIGDGITGLRSVAYDMSTVTYAGMDGDTVTQLRALPNTPTLGLLVQADDEVSFRAKARGLVHAMRPRVSGVVTPGTLTASRMDGTSRSLSCYCVAGLEGDEGSQVMGPGRWWKLALKFHGPDPWWLGDQQAVDVGLSAGGPFFPIFPLALAPSSVQGQFVLDLSGSDAPAYPIWTITGPGSSIVLTNVTTGASLSLDVSLVLGQSLTIDTRPQVRSVRRNDGVSLMPQVTPGTDPSLWSLVEGVNTVSATMTGATSDSRITGTYQARYAGI